MYIDERRTLFTFWIMVLAVEVVVKASKDSWQFLGDLVGEDDPIVQRVGVEASHMLDNEVR